MVQRIQRLRGLSKALNYNEKKLGAQQAELICAENFLKLPGQLCLEDKIKRFKDLMVLNERVQKNAVQISLNFHPSETDKLTKEMLKEISGEYMKRMGFANQPYLVYQHHDAGHPHVHIVSTYIGDEGDLVPKPSFWKSREYCNELEQIYGLVSANRNDLEMSQEQRAEKKIGRAQKLEYGRAPTTRGIATVMDFVINEYKYTSLRELNAVLRQYNVRANCGREGSRLHNNKGLIYQILDANGKSISKPIRASALSCKPTLMNLEKKFMANEIRRQPDLMHLNASIGWTLVKPQRKLREFVKDLQREGIDAVVVRDKEGKANGFAYVDYNTMSVFDEACLEQKYTARGILERLGIVQSNEQTRELINEQLNATMTQTQSPEQSLSKDSEKQLDLFVSQFLEALLKPEDTNEEQSHDLTQEADRDIGIELSREFFPGC
jgi:hypothetical protein